MKGKNRYCEVEMRCYEVEMRYEVDINSPRQLVGVL